MLLDKAKFLAESTGALSAIYDKLLELPPLNLAKLSAQNTVLVIIDMVNGFAREGALQSPRVAGLIPEITGLARKCDRVKIPKLAFADCHTEASLEFQAFPAHCLAGTAEGEIVDELKAIGGYTLIPKNSTNGFLEETFQTWLGNQPQIDTFILTGDCADICILQFATTIKAWFNMQNRKARVIVPMNAVETYDLGAHHGDLIQVMALSTMMDIGVEIVRQIE